MESPATIYIAATFAGIFAGAPQFWRMPWRAIQKSRPTDRQEASI
jgi:hypothetical protein